MVENVVQKLNSMKSHPVLETFSFTPIPKIANLRLLVDRACDVGVPLFSTDDNDGLIARSIESPR
jgi:hypothetical protein